MTKDEFVAEVARRAQLSNGDAGKAVDAFVAAITDTVKGGGEVPFSGFGKFSPNLLAWSDERVRIPGADVPKSSASNSGVKLAVSALRDEAKELGRDQHELRLEIDSARRQLRDVAAS